MSLTEIQTPQTENSARNVEVQAPQSSPVATEGMGMIAVHQLVEENVNPDEHIRTSLKDRFVNRFIKGKMGTIEQDLNKEHMELAEKQKVRPSLLHRELNDLAQEPEEPDPFDQRIQKANQMLARPQVSGAKKPVQAQAGPFRFDRQK